MEGSAACGGGGSAPPRRAHASGSTRIRRRRGANRGRAGGLLRGVDRRRSDHPVAGVRLAARCSRPATSPAIRSRARRRPAASSCAAASSEAGESFAEVAVPDASGNVLLLASPLRDVRATVRIVRDRGLWAGLGALAVASLVGFIAASAFTRRIRRLERAAERIASGDFGGARGRPGCRRARRARARVRADAPPARPPRRRPERVHRERLARAAYADLLARRLPGAAARTRSSTRRRGGVPRTASEQVTRLAKLATDLLDLSRIDAGQVRPARERVELATVAGASRGVRPPSRCRGEHRSRCDWSRAARLSPTRSGCCGSAAASSTTRCCTRRPAPPFA